MQQPSISPIQLSEWCNHYLNTSAFKDYCPNGLQIEADTPITKLITGVTASQNLINSAIAAKADAILVHHGYFWRGESQPLIGIKGRRIRSLIQNNMSLFAYHLPLDAHPIVGNNATLAKLLGLTITGALYPNEPYPIGNIASCPTQSIDVFIAKVKQALGRTPLHLSGGNAKITKVALCTGGAQDMIEQAEVMGCQLYISGEVSERTTHSARELGIDYLACGHHATEKGGVKALGQLIKDTFAIQTEFIDDFNPV